ncbi:hypothetical protein Xoosp13_18 [Xanthomonas phage Xoo-sp13]|nr:hypothetical protein Xoosp13_18 [Xanthomonas phage Xoo-sp13]
MNDTLESLEAELRQRDTAAVSRPKRPSTLITTSKDAEDLAVKMRKYEAQMAEFEAACVEARNRRNDIIERWNALHRKQNMTLNDVTYAIVMDIAYERGHSAGLSEVRSFFDDFESLAVKIINANK